MPTGEVARFGMEPVEVINQDIALEVDLEASTEATENKKVSHTSTCVAPRARNLVFFVNAFWSLH